MKSLGDGRQQKKEAALHRIYHLLYRGDLCRVGPYHVHAHGPSLLNFDMGGSGHRCFRRAGVSMSDHGHDRKVDRWRDDQVVVRRGKDCNCHGKLPGLHDEEAIATESASVRRIGVSHVRCLFD